MNWQVPDWTKLISVEPKFLTYSLNKDGRLEKKTHVVLINPNDDEMAVYRDSTSEPGKYSQEIFSVSKKKKLWKAGEKYPLLPVVPDGAIEYRISGIRTSTIAQLFTVYRTYLSAIIVDSGTQEPKF